MHDWLSALPAAACARDLVGFETATDGTAVKLLAEDAAGRHISIGRKIETLTALLVTLPQMASRVIEQWQSDPRTIR